MGPGRGASSFPFPKINGGSLSRILICRVHSIAVKQSLWRGGLGETLVRVSWLNRLLPHSRVPIGAESLSVSLAPRSFLSERCNAKSWRGYTYKQYEKTNG
ncbi:hypothetical protein DSY4857 [Desulfitobacterium hafniense Y51]|uniref:Uncharacterized protein n=1 Tax=Desulfitobacterium hafniense (strain Y51) TaxID=138119 RepID=Q24MU6_DESHY|nr:hypothetical protein DSY4857 [Desulfitobacterium hafniense Y51]